MLQGLKESGDVDYERVGEVFTTLVGLLKDRSETFAVNIGQQVCLCVHVCVLMRVPGKFACGIVSEGQWDFLCCVRSSRTFLVVMAISALVLSLTTLFLMMTRTMILKNLHLQTVEKRQRK